MAKAGDIYSAALQYEGIRFDGYTHPVIKRDAVITSARAGLSANVTNLFNGAARRVRLLERDREAVLLMYLREDDPSSLLRARDLCPDDLSVNFRLLSRRIYTDQLTPDSYLEAVKNFAAASVLPADPALIDEEASTVLELSRTGLWPPSQVFDVLASWVWRYPQSIGLQSALIDLRNTPLKDTAVETFLLAEQYQRRGEYRTAQQYYLELVDISLDPVALFRLGMVDEQLGAYEDAFRLYRRYYQLVPDDAFVLDRITALAAKLGTVADGSWETMPTASSDEVWVAEQLGVSTKQVALGSYVLPRKVQTSSSGAGGVWEARSYTGPDRNAGIYVTQQDALSPVGQVMRISSLRSTSATYGEVVSPVLSLSESQYLITLTYATLSFGEGSFLFLLGQHSTSEGVALIQADLPATHGKWQKLRWLVDGSDHSPIGALIRVRGAGHLLIDTLEIRPVLRTRSP